MVKKWDCTSTKTFTTKAIITAKTRAEAKWEMARAVKAEELEVTRIDENIVAEIFNH